MNIVRCTVFRCHPPLDVILRPERYGRRRRLHDEFHGRSTLFEQWGWVGFTLQRLKECHAWSIALGRDILAFEPGVFAFHVYEECAPDEALDEELDDVTPQDLEKLAAEYLSYSFEELQAMSPREVLEAMRDEGMDPDCCPRLAQQDSMEALIRNVMERDLLGVDWQFEGAELSWPLNKEAFRATLDHSPTPHKYAAFAAIEDAQLQRQALALHGDWIDMGMETDLEEVAYCRWVLWRRRGWELVVAWDAIPPLQEAGWCIISKQVTAS